MPVWQFDTTAEAITGVMPRWQQNLHKFRFVLFCLLFGAFSVFQLYSLAFAHEPQAIRGWLVITVSWLVIAAAGIGMQVSFLRRLVSEFSYSDCVLRFCTLGRREFQLRAITEITELGEWRGRGHPLGYCLLFSTGGKVYLQRSVSNSTLLAQQISRDLGTRT